MHSILLLSEKRGKTNVEEEGQYGSSSFPLKTMKVLALLGGRRVFAWKSKAAPKAKGPAAAGVPTSVMLGCLGKSPKSSAFSLRITPWGGELLVCELWQEPLLWL